MQNIILEDLKLLLEEMTIPELKELARMGEISLSGNKEVLVNRLYDYFIESRKKYIEDLFNLNENYKYVNKINEIYCNISMNEERNKKIIYNVLNNKKNVDYLNSTFDCKEKIIFEDEDTYDTFIKYLEGNNSKKNLFIEKYYSNEKNIENLESKYLELYYHFFLFYIEDILKGLKTKNDIKEDWEDFWDPSGEISNFSTGAERVIYALINGRGIGNPNSAPVGSDLFFELDDAYIHMDLKTVSSDNIGDYISDIFVGNNQNSYNGYITIGGKQKIYDNANLPTRYNKGKDNEKIVLTYFITILYDNESLDVLNINLLSMPNGELYDIYGEEILKAGKNQYDKNSGKKDTHAETIRYKWSEAILFETLYNKRRIKVIYLNKNMKEQFKKKLTLINKINNMQYNN